MALEIRFIKNITKDYGDYVNIIEYKEPKPFFVSENARYGKRRSDAKTSYSSICRTKTLIKDYVLCNDFDLFVTFTFSPEKVDRFNYNSCANIIKTWLKHQQNRGKEVLRYLVIPEQHKNGAWHFHALMSGYSGKLRDSGVLTRRGQVIYNLPSYRSGFTTAVFLSDKKAVATYVTKYVTKSLDVGSGRRHFFASHNLNRPLRTLNSPLLREIKRVAPLLATPDFESQTQFYYNLPHSAKEIINPPLRGVRGVETFKRCKGVMPH